MTSILYLLISIICLFQIGCGASTGEPRQQKSALKASPSPAKSESEHADPGRQLEGSWVAVRGEAQGEPTLLEGFSFTFKKGKFTAVSPGNTAEGEYSLDVTKSPMQITFEGIGYGIFRFQGDELHLCIDGDRRPTSFSTSKDSSGILTICKRSE